MSVGVRDLVPPLLLRYYKSSYYSRRVYDSWEDATLHAEGYGEANILERVAEATWRVKRGEAAYERDSVTFDRKDFVWPVAFGLAAATAANRGVLSVLDFGGSLGSSYFQHRGLLGTVGDLRWGIVEQPHFVARGNRDFGSDELRFFPTIDACVSAQSPTVALMSSVLQYLPDPYSVLAEILAQPSIRYVILDRTTVATGASEKVLVQRVPSSIYRASYPVWILSRDRLLERLTAKLDVIAEFDGLDDPFYHDGRLIRSTGWLLHRKS